jgi:hypothetical protein
MSGRREKALRSIPISARRAEHQFEHTAQVTLLQTRAQRLQAATNARKRMTALIWLAFAVFWGVILAWVFA